jgi:hypothetical protein
MAGELKSSKELCNNYIYHLVVDPIRVHWKIHNRIESSIKEFEEMQYPYFPKFVNITITGQETMEDYICVNVAFNEPFFL